MVFISYGVIIGTIAYNGANNSRTVWFVFEVKLSNVMGCSSSSSRSVARSSTHNHDYDDEDKNDDY